MAKRLTEIQKKIITKSFKDGQTIDSLHKDFNCTKFTIIRNLKIQLGEENYKRQLKKNKELIINDTSGKHENISNSNLSLEENIINSEDNKNFDKFLSEKDFYPDSAFLEISPLDCEIDNTLQKELSSVPISEIDFPQIVYLIVDKKIELEVKLLKDFPEWDFLPQDDLNRKTIEIYFDLKVAKSFCTKEQKVLKVPNTNVFKIAAPFLIAKGISRIVSADKLIAL